MRKFLPYILILIILVGLFSPMMQVNAQTPTPAPGSPEEEGTCITPQGRTLETTRGKCGQGSGFVPKSIMTPSTTPSRADNTFQQQIDEGCGSLFTWTLTGCFLKFVYYTAFMIPTFLLWLSAQFFNAMISLGISSSITSQTSFIPSAWAVVRDISNIFFILILLYVAIETILGMSHEAKKIIVRVIIMALLINFSMFFTKVVIDSSNILALVFYNKLDVQTQEANGHIRDYTPSTPNNEKDVSGAMWKKFDATQLLTGDTLKTMMVSKINGQPVESLGPGTKLPMGLTLGMMIISGWIMTVAAYTFFVSGFMFVGRLIELWVLIIFSPFAFMSWPIPLLSGAPYIGWSEWSKRLIATSFMAPIFMFFLYLIFKLIGANPFTKFTPGTGAMATILGTLIPAMIIMALLLKAKKFAEKGGGQFGEMVMKGAKMAGGLALTAATSGTSALAVASVGRAGAAAANSKWAKNWAAKGFGGEAVMTGLQKVGSASFDVQGKRKGGFTERRAADIKKRQERAQEIEVGEDEPLKQAVNKLEEDKHALLEEASHEISQIDAKIKSANEHAAAMRGQWGTNDPEALKAGKAVVALREQKSAIKNAKAENLPALQNNATAMKTAATNAATAAAADTSNKDLAKAAAAAKDAAHAAEIAVKVAKTSGEIAEARGLKKEEGRSINDLEDTDIPNAEHHVKQENIKRRSAYANKVQGGWNRGLNFVLSGGQYALSRGANEAASKIRTESKISSGGADHSGKKGGGHAPAPAAHAPAPTPPPASGGSGSGHSGGGGHTPGH